MNPQYIQGLTQLQANRQKALIRQSQRESDKGFVFDRPKVSDTPTKRSKHVIAFEKKYGFSVSDHKKVKELFKDTDVEGILSKGRGAYGSSGSRPNVSIEQWSNARLASVLTGGPALKIDKDLIGPKSLEIIHKK